MDERGSMRSVEGYPHLVRRDGAVYLRGSNDLTTREFAGLVRSGHTTYDVLFMHPFMPPAAVEEAAEYAGVENLLR